MERKPGVDHSTNHGSFLWHLETSEGPLGEWVGQEDELLTLQITPAAAVPLGMPNQVNGTFPHTLPVRYLHRGLLNVNLEKGAGRDQVSHRVILHAHDSIAVTSGFEALQ